MNLIDILLLEAVRINNGKEAYELIKSNKLGVKIHPSYNVDNDDKNEFISILDQIIEKSSANDKVFTIQLFLNKVPMNQMLTFADRSYIYKAISYRNKPWAKDYPGYKEFISFNGKDINYKDLSKLVEDLEIEAQRHGHGDKKEVKNLYDDGTWTLQVPLSFKGEKAIAFYGKRGERQIPTEWCTRTDLNWYNKYASQSPLYVIRNWETGKSYQVSFEEDVVNFLDQKDVKGDEITKGNLLSIPNKLLELIKWKGKTLKDYKDMDKATTRGKLTKGSSFKDATVELERARWGNDIKLSNNVIKNVWENYSEVGVSGDRLTDYMINNKTPGYVKHAGNWAAKYYFKNNPDYFILMKKADWEENFEDYYYIDGNSDIEAVGLGEFEEGEPNYKLLLRIAQDDIGSTKRTKRLEKKWEHDDETISRKFTEEAKKTFTKYFNDININKDFFNIINKYFPNSKPELERTDIYQSGGRFLPLITYIKIIDKENKNLGSFVMKRIKSLDYKADLGIPLKEDLRKRGKQIPHLEMKFNLDIGEAFKKLVLKYSKEMLKNKSGLNLRSNARNTNSERDDYYREIDQYKKTYFENYFPY